MKQHKFKDEAELAAKLIEWLEQDERREVFQEVQIERGGPKADIVVLQDGHATVIETKLSFTFDALFQAKRWKTDAAYVLVAVPTIYDLERRELARQVCDTFGVGLVFVSEHVGIDQRPIRSRLASSRLVDHLIEHGADYKSGKFAKAGTKDGGHVTDSNVALQAVREFVDENPGCQLKQAVKATRSKWCKNWRSEAIARNAITKLLNQGAIKGITHQDDGGVTVLYPATQGARA